MKQPISLIVITILSLAILKIGYSQQIKERLQYDYSFKQRKSGKVCKLFPKKKLRVTVKYYSNGRIKEKINIGEHWQPFEDDSTTYCLPIIIDSDTCFTKNYYSYVNDSLVDKIEQWQFINQKKSFLISILVYEYDSAWNKVSLTKLQSDGSLWNKLNYIKAAVYSESPISFSFDNRKHENLAPQYFNGSYVVLDSENRTLERFSYFGSDLLSYSTVHYSKNPDLVETKLTYFENRHDLCEIETKYYNDKNKIVKTISINLNIQNESESKVLFHYDKNGLLKKKEYFINNRLTSMSKYKYEYY